MASRVASPELVGRTAEVAALMQAAAAAAAGTPRFAFIGGESGVGKTRLVQELACRTEAQGARVLSGDCIDLGDAELAYAPLVGALRAVDVAELERVAGSNAGELAPLLPQLDRPDVAPAPTTLAQGRLFELLLGVLGGLADERPLMLVVEDAHWADRSTRDFLAFLVRNARRERLLVAATYRTEELHRRHPLRAFLADADRAPSVLRLVLEGLSREELVQLLAGILGHRPAPRLVDELFRRAEGNPFFTEELVAASGGEPGARLPEDVRDALMLRIEALSPDAQAVLRAAAAAGTRVRHALLQRASGLDEAALVAGLREAVAHQVLVLDPATDAYRFRHGLLREAILDDLLPGERGPLHGALARALSEDPSLSASGRGVAAELAFHWFAAHDLPAAFAASAQAGEEAERVAAFGEANAHFERAAELWDAVPAEQRPASPSRLELLRRAAEAAHLSGDPHRAIALTRRGLALVDLAEDPMAAAALHERLGRYLWVAGLSRDALDELGTAVSLLPPGAPAAERARVVGAEGHLLMVLGRSVQARRRCEEALALARSAGAARVECTVLNSLGPALDMTGELEAGIATVRAARAIAEELGDLEEMTRAAINLGEMLDQAGAVPEAAEVAREGVAMARREGLRSALPMLLGELGARLVRLGRWDDAASALEEALDAPQAWGVGRVAALASAAQLDALRGDAASAQERLDEAEREQPQAIGAIWTAPITTIRAEIALAARHPERARELVEAELAARDESDHTAVHYLGPVVAVGARAEADLAARARATGAGAEEAEAIARAERLVAQVHAIVEGDEPPESALFTALAEAEAARARGAATPATWSALADRWDAFGMPYPAAYARWREAEAALALSGPRGDVADVLAGAHATALSLGAAPLREEIAGLARRARIPLGDGTSRAAGDEAAAPSAADLTGLTSREHDVLRLVAAGSTNREIAQALYISQKTVSVHVSRILSKLDARTRVEAAGIAHRLGLLPEDAPS